MALIRTFRTVLYALEMLRMFLLTFFVVIAANLGVEACSQALCREEAFFKDCGRASDFQSPTIMDQESRIQK
jgi:hypothetical protein